ncbi:MAG: DUF3313 family protein [Nitrospirae bacterium]|nr:DUF3313 family protein [Nitrospirota bacterium]
MRGFFNKALIIIAILVLANENAFAKKDKFVESDEYKEKKAPTGFIKNYEGMIEGKDIKWVWVKEGVKFGKYDSVRIESFETIADKTNKDIQKGLRSDFGTSFQRIGKKVSDSGQLIIKGAVYKVEEYNVGKKIGMSFIPGAGGVLSRTQGNPTVGVEIIIIDAATKEEIARIRHEAQDPTLNSAATEVADDIANFIRDSK